MPSYPEIIECSGGDFFIISINKKIQRGVLSRNTSRLILSLDKKLNKAEFERVISSSPIIKFIAGAKLKRKFLTPVWKMNGNGNCKVLPSFKYSLLEKSKTLHHYKLSDESIIKGNICFELSENECGNSDIIFKWNHEILDAKGAELLLSHLDSLFKGNADNSQDILTNKARCIYDGKNLNTFFKKAEYARISLPLIMENSKLPISQLIPEGYKCRKNSGEYYKIYFTEDETQDIYNNCARNGAGFRKSIYYLAACIKAVSGILKIRGGKIHPFYIPVPHNLRKCGAKFPVISNHVTFLFFRIEPELLGSISEIYKCLEKQMMEQIRKEVPESFAMTTDLFRTMPYFASSYLFAHSTKGKMASFFFSDTGDSSDVLDSFMDINVEDITHIPPLSYPPGLVIAFSKFKSRLSFSITYPDGILSNEETKECIENIKYLLIGRKQ